MNHRHHSHSSAARWLPIGAAAGLLAAVVAAGVISGGGDSGSSSTTVNAASGGVATTLPLALTELPADDGPISTENYDDRITQSDDAVVKVPLDRTLTDGLAGDDVMRVQQRLKDLAFDPGPIDGIYGTMTKQSVWAFEKLIMGVPRQQATGKVTPEMWDRMQDPIEVQPRRPTGGLADHTEVYLPEQVMIVFHADRPALITHVASGELDAAGEPAKYCETITIDTDASGTPLDEPVQKAICGFSKTPAGVFEAYRKVPGTRNGPLGSMYDPIYINYGIAIHGAINVPLEPASHGCIRVSRHIGEYLQDILELGDRVLIWDGKKEPEQQSERDMLPVFDFPDPDATTTTTSTTTTSTTVAPTTTPATTTTQAPPPATTTTSKPPATTTTSKPPATTVPAAPTTSATTAPPASTSTTVEPVDDL